MIKEEKELSNKEFAEKYVGQSFYVKKYNTLATVIGYDTTEHIVLYGDGLMLLGSGYNNEGNTILKDDAHGNSYTYQLISALTEAMNEKKPIVIEEVMEEKVDNRAVILEDVMKRFKDVKRIIVNDQATIIILKDDTKAVVKPSLDEIVDFRVGILECILKARAKRDKNRITISCNSNVGTFSL